MPLHLARDWLAATFHFTSDKLTHKIRRIAFGFFRNFINVGCWKANRENASFVGWIHISPIDIEHRIGYNFNVNFEIGIQR
jgi:hypothetical protein